MPNLRDTRTARDHLAGSAPDTDGPRSGAPANGPVPKAWLVFARSGMAARLALALVVGSGFGAATEWSVPHLPFALEQLGNTAAPWILVACAVALTGRRMRESLLLAILTLLALVLGFYVAEACRGWGVSRHQVAFWFAASVVAGPLVGLAAAWLRHATGAVAALGAGVLAGR